MMPEDLYRACLVLCVIVDQPEHKKIHDILVKHCDAEAKSRGFTGWVEAYHTCVPAGIKRGNFFDELIPNPNIKAWHETGDLPPVGAECIIKWDLVSPEEKELHELYNNQEVIIVGHDEYPAGDVAIFRLKKGYRLKPLYALVASGFRHIQSDRDKAIDEMAAAIKAVDCEDFLGALYDAGFRKPDQDLKSQLKATEMWKGALVEVVNDFIKAIDGRIPTMFVLDAAAEKAKELLDSMEQK
jgi:hypothetical protein